MFTVEYLEKEHEGITKVINKVEEKCIKIVNGEEINDDYFRKLIVFIRKYADDAHHKKEEDILFKYMSENLGEAAEKLINYAMLQEHQMARYYVLELEKYLNEYKLEKSDKNKIQVLANAMSYVNLLRLHIDKENNVVYPFGAKNLSEDIKNKVEEEMKVRTEEEKEILKDKENLLKILLK
ncbi:hemerythrin domain-containing protein [Miniphocaeibacter massiliensis]|uniref:hemerythrin domain-containing protein n=1 Tax=Miniphocaeibacter massiliensis TaxID=2041841 RepID=UPI000C1C668D|nr:hemerythrin domain-containing protein [Miniphocaeibacter massiliensis]